MYYYYYLSSKVEEIWVSLWFTKNIFSTSDAIFVVGTKL